MARHRAQLKALSNRRHIKHRTGWLSRKITLNVKCLAQRVCDLAGEGVETRMDLRLETDQLAARIGIQCQQRLIIDLDARVRLPVIERAVCVQRDRNRLLWLKLREAGEKSACRPLK